jgi:hypothetical protein
MQSFHQWVLTAGFPGRFAGEERSAGSKCCSELCTLFPWPGPLISLQVEEQELEEELAALLAAPASPVPQPSGPLKPPSQVSFAKSEEQKEQEEAEEVDALMARLQAMRVPDATVGREGTTKEKERARLALPAG